jgi:mRNA interferase HicA
MKRVDLVRHLNEHGCELAREGAGHSIFINKETGKRTTVPRHREISDFTAAKICRQLGIPEPR